MSELEQALLAVGRELEVPEAPDLVPAVLHGIDRPRARPARRRVVVAIALVLVAALAAALASPDARSAFLRILHIGGERIELVEELPPIVPSPPELDIELTLGERVSLGEARRRARYDLLELDRPPDRVYLGPRDTVWFLYGRPDAVRLLVGQTPEVTVDEPFILKKLAGAGTRIETTAVRGAPAYFLSGEPHAVMLLDESGTAYPETARLARDVLVWADRGRTVRLEGELTLAEALELARSLR
jgi:hypothetical protein